MAWSDKQVSQFGVEIVDGREFILSDWTNGRVMSFEFVGCVIVGRLYNDIML